MGYFKDPNTGKRVWSGGIANRPNPMSNRMRPLPARARASVRPTTNRDPVVAAKVSRSREKAKRTVPSSSPVSNGPPRSSASSSYTPSTPVTRPAPRTSPKPAPSPTPRRTSTPTPAKKDVSRPAPKQPYKFQKGTSMAAKIYNRALSRYRARHRKVGGDVAAKVVEKLIYKQHKGYTSDEGFKGKGKLKAPRPPVRISQLGGPDKPPASSKKESPKTRRPDNKPRYKQH